MWQDSTWLSVFRCGPLPSLRLDPPGGRVISIGVDTFMGVEVSVLRANRFHPPSGMVGLSGPGRARSEVDVFNSHDHHITQDK